MPRACAICTHPDQEAVREAFAAGGSDREIAQQFGVSHMAIGRHRRGHIVKPMRAAVAALDRGRAARHQREEQLAAAEAGDPAAFVALAGIVTDLRKVHERLERTADAAEQDNQRLAVSALSAQQLRAAEVRAKIGGIGGYAPARAADQAAGGQIFAINIRFASTGETVSISTPVQSAVPETVVDGELEDE